jgi:potassium efflux system protein
MFTRPRIPARSLPGGFRGAWLLTSLLLGFCAPTAHAQNSLIEKLASPTAQAPTEAPSSAETGSPSEDPRSEIEALLGQARDRRAAFRDAYRAGEPNSPADRGHERKTSSGAESLERLIRVLEQRREAEIQRTELAAGRDAIEAALNRAPSELFGEPPPFPVPILDGVMRAWRDAADREEQHERVYEDRRANVGLAKKIVDDLEKNRRRVRELRERQDVPLERIRLEAEEREIEDGLAVARQQLALAKQLAENTRIELEIKQTATEQALAARAWIEAHLAPRESDLADAIERLDRQRADLEREIDLARSRVRDAESRLRDAEDRRDRLDPRGTPEAIDLESEIATRRNQLGHRQQLVALLNQRVERLGRTRTTWQHRYAVLGDRLDLDEAPKWLSAAERELERLARSRRIKEAELASLRLELSTIFRELPAPGAPADESSRWLEREFEDLELLVNAAVADLAALEESIHLEQTLRAELRARLEGRDLGERIQAAAQTLRGFWSYEITTSEDSPITPGKILIALFVVAAGYLLARIAMRWLGRRAFPRLGFDAGASNAFASLAFYAIQAIVFLLALRAVNIPLTAFAVVGGALALGIGFGSQAIVSNFISGLLLLAERPIRTGDLIEIGGVVGSVESIGLRSTRIRTPDNFHIIVPNASFLETNVINWTHEDPLIRVRIAVGVAYGSPIREVERLLIQASAEHPRTLKSPPPAVYFEDFGDSALAFEVRFWIRYDERTDRSLVRSEIRFRVNELFAENGIVIAFPQLDVHIDPPGSDRPSSP